MEGKVALKTKPKQQKQPGKQSKKITSRKNGNVFMSCFSFNDFYVCIVSFQGLLHPQQEDWEILKEKRSV